MKVRGRQSASDKFPAQRLAEVRRPTEPNAGGTPIGNLLADLLNRQPAVPCRDHNMQVNLRLFCTEFDSADEFFVGDAGAVEQVDAPAVGRVRQCLHPGDEWRDADTARHPNLARHSVAESETAVGTFHLDQIAHFQGGREGARVVAKALDEKKHSAVAAPRR